MKKHPLLRLTELADIHDHLRVPVNQTERNNKAGQYPYYGATGQVGWIDDYKIDGRYVLLGEDGAPFLDADKPKAYIVEGRFWVNNHAHVLKGKEGICDDEYLCHVLNWFDYSDAVTGSTRLKLPQSSMYRMLIPAPPFDEQRRIAAHLKAQMTEIEKARKALAFQLVSISNLLDIGIENILNISMLKNGDDVILGDVISITAKLVDPALPGVRDLPHVSAENIVSITGEFINLKSAADDGMKSNKYLFDEGDVLYSKLRPYLRKVAFPNFSGLCSADMYPLKVNPELIEAGFLKILLGSNLFTAYANEKSARSRMPKLNREQLFSWKFCLPPLKDQRECVQRVNLLIHEVTDAKVASMMMTSDMNVLPTKILAQAFEM